MSRPKTKHILYVQNSWSILGNWWSKHGLGYICILYEVATISHDTGRISNKLVWGDYLAHCQDVDWPDTDLDTCPLKLNLLRIIIMSKCTVIMEIQITYCLCVNWNEMHFQMLETVWLHVEIILGHSQIQMQFHQNDTCSLKGQCPALQEMPLVHQIKTYLLYQYILKVATSSSWCQIYGRTSKSLS